MILLQAVKPEGAEPLALGCSFNSFGGREIVKSHTDGHKCLYKALNVEIMHAVAIELSNDFQNIKMKLFEMLECSVASAKIHQPKTDTIVLQIGHESRHGFY